MKFSNITTFWSSLIAEELSRLGVKHVCLAPGSRNAPLVKALSRQGSFDIHVCVDERAMAFLALGIAASSRSLVLLVTTSGTAVANLLPGIVEASKKKIPLIVMTADRPPELQKTGANQTIEQKGIFSHFVRFEAELPPPTIDIPPSFVLSTLDQATHRSQGELPGPVHVNCQIRDPYGTARDVASKSYLSKIKPWIKGCKPLTTYVRPEMVSDGSFAFSRLGKSGMILVGKLSGEEEAQRILKLAEHLGWPLIPDVTSGLRWSSHSHVLPQAELALSSRSFYQKLPTETVLHFGGRMTSKRLYTFLASADVKEHIHILKHPLRSDPSHRVTLRVQSQPGVFAFEAIKALPQRKPIAELHGLKGLHDKLVKRTAALLKGLSEPALAFELSRIIPKTHTLFLGNSMPVRDMNTFAASGGGPKTVSGNRGASGIDGCIATAIGISLGSQAPVTAFLGDQSALHDLNSLGLTKGLNKPVVLIIVNNGGGGIFSLLEHKVSSQERERLFTNSHKLDFSLSAKMFGLKYMAPKSLASFVSSYRKACKAKGLTVLEVKTDLRKDLKLREESNGC